MGMSPAVGKADHVLGGDVSHDVVRVMDPLPAVVAERVGQGIGDFGPGHFVLTRGADPGSA